MENPVSTTAPHVSKQTFTRAGYSTAIAHHGEVVQGVFESDGRLRRGLISLICELFRSEATFTPDFSGVVRVEPVFKVKAQRAAQVTLALLNANGIGGRLKIDSNTPMKWGLGSSTSDVTSAIKAVANALDINLSMETIARLAVKTEAASDPIMFGHQAVLFAHRHGEVIEDLGGPLPSLEVIGFNTDATGTGIDTQDFPPARYTWWEIEAFRPLLGLMRQAIRSQSPQLVGQVASASARINQRYLPIPHFDRIDRLAERVEAVGIQVAHSGTVAGLLFSPFDALVNERIQVLWAMLRELGFGPIWRFRTGQENISIKCDAI